MLCERTADSAHTTTETQGGSTNPTTRTYVYNAADRLNEVQQNTQTIATYQYDSMGRRIRKTTGGTTTYFLYGTEGLLAEMNAQGQLTQIYGWPPQNLWGTDPLWQASLAQGQTLANAAYTFLATDHLGTPQVAMSASGQKLWKGLSEAFGKTTAEQGSAMAQNLRFPGQYYDAETQMHQNYFRDYRPELGRYLEADPIGLMGGDNTYGYGNQNPNYSVDNNGNLAIPVPIIVFTPSPIVVPVLIVTGVIIAGGVI